MTTLPRPVLTIRDDHLPLLLSVVAAAREWKAGKDGTLARLLQAVNAYDAALARAEPVATKAR